MKKTLLISFCFIAILGLSSCNRFKNKGEVVKLIPVKSGENFQFIDTEGKIVINPQFSEATIFRNGRALVRSSGENSKWGYIDEEGKYAISPNYLYATAFSEDIAWVVNENSAPTAINTNGEVLGTMQNAERVRVFKEGLSAFSVMDSAGYKWGFMDKNLSIAINPQFSRTEDFSEGLCAVRNGDGKWGFIDKEGLLKINYQFDVARSFHKNKAIVSNGDKYGVIDEDGKYVINPQFEELMYDGENFIFKQNSKYGWCDNEGKIFINPQFTTALPFNNNDIAPVQSGELFGFIDMDGKYSVNPQFDSALPLNGKISLVKSGNKIGFVDNEGKFVINPQFDEVSFDYLNHVCYGNGTFQSIQTDYFNVDAITSVIEIEAPEGFDFNSTYGEIVAGLNLDVSTLSKTSSESRVIVSRKINENASYNFWVIGTPYIAQQVQRGYGWYSYYDTEYQYNEQAIPIAYAYAIELFGKGIGKEQIVLDAISKKLIGYTKNEEKSEEKNWYFSNGKSYVRLYTEGTAVYLILSTQEFLAG